ncbi:antitoxin [Bilifractor sp. LCP19S3_H10]|uniref:antitoxin n=1 Tax=Bilifractor sp. LCP19S3_H10 TaxID=3438736 RepID=UPI003F8E5F83
MTNTLTKTKVFQNGNSQAIRIPQDMRTDKKEYYIHKVGDTYIAFPTDDAWATVREVIGTFPSDFLDTRDQPSPVDIPEREDF